MLFYFIQDALVKQGMYTQYAENLLKSVSDMVDCPRYDVTLAKTSIVSLMPHIQTEGKLSETNIVMISVLTRISCNIQYNNSVRQNILNFYHAKINTCLTACDISIWF